MPEPFLSLEGVAAALPAANIDTDVIMPKVFLKGIDRSGLARGVFHDLRFTQDGLERPEFVLNRAPWREARFLVTGANFGCGSSREHAVWGLAQLGIRAVVGESFAGIFFDNCANNGIAAIVVPAPVLRQIAERATDPARCRIMVDLQTCRITAEDAAWAFEIDPGRREALMAGADTIARTLAAAAEIRSFEAGHWSQNPWLSPG